MDKTSLVLGAWVVWTVLMIILGYCVGRSHAWGKLSRESGKISREWSRIGDEWVDLLEASRNLRGVK